MSGKQLVSMLALNAYPIVRTMVRGVVFVASFHYAYLIISVLAGEETNATIELILSIARKPSNVAATFISLLAGSGVVFAASQFILRRSTSKRLQARIQELERKIDPDRRTENHKNGE